MPAHPAGSGVPVDVTVIGEAIVDVLQTPSGETRAPGGSPLNVAVGLGRLGVSTRLIACVGSDADGELLRAHLRASGVSECGLLLASRTSSAVVRVQPDGTPDYAFDVEWELPLGVRPEGRLLHVGSIGAILDPGAAQVERIVGERGLGVTASFDPNIRHGLIRDPDATRLRILRLMRGSDIVKLSDEDAEWIFPGCPPDEVLQRVLDGGSRLAVLTCGPAGALLRVRDARVEVSASAGTVVDTVGAGDSFMAGMLAVVCRSGLPAAGNELGLRALGEFASRCAAITVARQGADVPWKQEVCDERNPECMR